MSISESQPQDCIAVDQSADHDELVQIVADLADTVREQNKRIDEQDERIDELQEQLKEERATRAKESAEDRQRIHQVEQAVEEQESTGSNPTPQTEENGTDGAAHAHRAPFRG
jgi:hypothetical protein